MPAFVKATRKNLKARILLIGPTGSGKTYSALRIATALGKPIAVVDTENRSASKYVDEVNPDGGLFAFDVLDMADNEREPENFIRAIETAERAGYGTLIIDSLSHAWTGVLAELDKKTGGKGDFSAWKTITPRHNALVAKLTSCKMHLICSLRTKSEFVVEENDRGKKVPRRIGVAPVFRDGVEFEFDICLESHENGSFTVTKTRAPSLFEATFVKPGASVAEKILAWLSLGVSDEPPTDDPARVELLALARSTGKPATIAWAEKAIDCRTALASLRAKIASALPTDQPASAIDFSAREEAVGDQGVRDIRTKLGISAAGPVPADKAEAYNAALTAALEAA